MASTPARLCRLGNVSFVMIYGELYVAVYEDETGKYAYHREQIAEGIGLISNYDTWKKNQTGRTNMPEWYRYLVERVTHHHNFTTSKY